MLPDLSNTSWVATVGRGTAFPESVTTKFSFVSRQRSVTCCDGIAPSAVALRRNQKYAGHGGGPAGEATVTTGLSSANGADGVVIAWNVTAKQLSTSKRAARTTLSPTGTSLK